MLDELMSRVGTPAVILVFAAVVWDRLRRLDADGPRLWKRIDNHERRISRLEGIDEADR